MAYGEDDDKVIAAYVQRYPTLKPTGNVLWKQLENEMVILITFSFSLSLSLSLSRSLSS